MRPTPWKLDLRMFDLTPRGRYKHLIQPWNLLVGFPPVERPPDYVVIDPPYFAIVKHQVTHAKPPTSPTWTWRDGPDAMQQIARSCASARAKRCTVVVPNYWAADGTVVLCTEIVRAAWAAVGYPLVGKAYATRHIQQQQSGRMGNLNNSARRNRQMLSDISEVMTFARPPEPRQGRRTPQTARVTRARVSRARVSRARPPDAACGPPSAVLKANSAVDDDDVLAIGKEDGGR